MRCSLARSRQVSQKKAWSHHPAGGRVRTGWGRGPEAGAIQPRSRLGAGPGLPSSRAGAAEAERGMGAAVRPNAGSTAHVDRLSRGTEDCEAVSLARRLPRVGGAPKACQAVDAVAV